jgi:hypothetical protein
MFPFLLDLNLLSLGHGSLPTTIESLTSQGLCP